MKFETLESVTMYRGRAFNVRRDAVRLPNGRTTHLDIVEHSGAITIVPIDELGRIWFVRQYRHATGELLLELPAGTLEADEPPLEAARREIREEVGMAAAKLTLIGEFFLAPGYSTEYMYMFLAEQLSPDPLQQDEDEFLSVEKYSLDEAFLRAAAGEIRDAKSLLGLYQAHSYLIGVK
jgi:ADP-ribose pyrophosphatase